MQQSRQQLNICYLSGVLLWTISLKQFVRYEINKCARSVADDNLFRWLYQNPSMTIPNDVFSDSPLLATMFENFIKYYIQSKSFYNHFSEQQKVRFVLLSMREIIYITSCISIKLYFATTKLIDNKVADRQTDQLAQVSANIYCK